MIGPIKVSRSLKELCVKIKEIQEEWLKKKGEEITIGQISKELKISKEEVAMALESQRPLESIDQQIYDDSNGETKIGKIDNGKDETGELITKICLDNLIKKLSEREQKIIILRYYKEKTQSEVAKVLGITQVQVSRLEKKILLNMRQKIS